jgi:HSP20 family protein
MAVPAVRSSQVPPVQPFGRDVFRDFDALFDQLSRRTVASVWSPLADVSETGDAYLIELDLPGVGKDEVAIDLTGTKLSVTGEIKERENTGLVHRRTRRTGRFAYHATLPRGVDNEKVDASMSDGVLTVRVPKSESAKPRRITIS